MPSSRTFDRRLYPLEPIYDVRKRTGALDVGNTPETPTSNYVALALPAMGLDMAQYGDYVFVTGRDVGFVYAIDVSDKANPQLASSLNVGGQPRGIAVSDSGAYAFISDFTGSRIRSINISNPLGMSVVSNVAMASSPQQLSIYGNTVYTGTDAGAELVAVDVTNPSAMSVLGSFDPGGTGDSQGTVVVGNVGYISTLLGSFMTVNVTNPAAMTLLDSVSLNQANLLDYDPVSAHCFVTYEVIGVPMNIASVDVANPSVIAVSDTLVLSQTIGDVMAKYPVLYVCASDGLTLVDVADPTDMSVTTVADVGTGGLSFIIPDRYNSGYAYGTTGSPTNQFKVINLFNL